MDFLQGSTGREDAIGWERSEMRRDDGAQDGRAGSGWAVAGGGGLRWVNRPAGVRTVAASMALDRGLELPVVRVAAVAEGSPRLRLEGEGEFVVEVFVQLVARTDADLVMRTGERVLDGRLRAAALRMYPGSKRQRTWALSGVARGVRTGRRRRITSRGRSG
jgi:hypothetical protein